jgi:hypothetical protein
MSGSCRAAEDERTAEELYEAAQVYIKAEDWEEANFY